MSKSFIIVDDSLEDRFFVRRCLSGLEDDVDIREFTYCEHALDYFRDAPDGSEYIVLVDINIPRMNGFDFIERCAVEFGGKKRIALTFVVISHSIDPSDKTRAEQNDNVAAFLSKPVSKETLGLCLDQIQGAVSA